MELCAANDVVFDCGHVSGREAVVLVEEAKRRGCTRIRTHCARYAPEEIAAIVAAGGFAEFSFFVLTHATQVGLTHVDEERHKIASNSVIQDYTPRIRAAEDRAILSTDAGVYLLPPPVEAFREYLMLVESEGFTETEIRRMTAANPARLFRIGGASV
jgi:predicted metal-dependent phosphotriesterase family hydrolase